MALEMISHSPVEASEIGKTQDRCEHQTGRLSNGSLNVLDRIHVANWLAFTGADVDKVQYTARESLIDVRGVDSNVDSKCGMSK